MKPSKYRKLVGPRADGSPAKPPRQGDILDEWVNWRGRFVQRLHYTWSRKGELDPIVYLVIGGLAANAIRNTHICDPGDLVLVPVTRDTDEDSFTFAKVKDLVFVKGPL